jgi:acetylornithine deacetylase/succinyl-diaminopimelate desuccinylase-like protein
MRDLQEFVDGERPRMLEELKEFLSIPSISTNPERAADCRRAAAWIREHLRALGCPQVDLLGSDTHPVVYGQGPAVEGRPTVIVYGHYDVQPADPLDLWESPPFEPTERNGNLYARGATDDKGQVFSIVKAFEAVSRNSAPPVNFRFIIEGQEESGSGVLFDLLERQPGLVAGDAVLVADMPYHAPGWPAVVVGLRGICYTEITLRTLQGDLHSGLYGGVAPNAIEMLVGLLAKLKSPDGRIRIPGLYDSVEPPTPEELDAWSRLPFDEERFLADEVGAKALSGLTGHTVFERLWALPTFEIHGIVGGFVGAGAKTVIPAVATAKVSLRLVPNQRMKAVEEQLRHAVETSAPPYADVSVRLVHGADPVLVDMSSRPFALIDRAFEEVEGRGVVPTRSGGSIPVVPALGQKGAAVVLAGIGLPDDRLHAPNEKINLDQVWKGVRVFGRFFELMAENGR